MVWDKKVDWPHLYITFLLSDMVTLLAIQRIKLVNIFIIYNVTVTNNKNII
jgi:hypothetical protein